MLECSRGSSARAVARASRLRKPEQYAAATGERATWRATRELLAATARVQPLAESERLAAAQKLRDSVDRSASLHRLGPGDDSVRFGFTVARRQARRAVQRTLVKRVLREAARSAAATLCPIAMDRRIDIVLRLRSPLPGRCQMSWAQLKRSLRAEADSLIAQLARHLRSGAQ